MTPQHTESKGVYRIYAENPRNNFLPDVGPLLHISNPTPSPSLRLEEGFAQGSNIEVFYDPMISKLVAHGRDRTEALRVLSKALSEYQIVGVATNIEFLRTLALNKHFIDGEVETGFINARLASTSHCSGLMNLCFP
jgi:3-methylcrotonyl-CoA carboxylase alpha subunit